MRTSVFFETSSNAKGPRIIATASELGQMRTFISPGHDWTTVGSWDVPKCSLHYAIYAVTVFSTDRRTYVAKYTVGAHHEFIPPTVIVHSNKGQDDVT